MIIYDLFAGTGSATKAFEDAGHTVIKIELDEQFEAHERDVLAMTTEYLITNHGQPDFIWASPPCTTFSVASIGRHWNKDKTPKSEQSQKAIELVEYTLSLIQDLDPNYGWLMENPRGMLRTLPVVKDIKRRTITYCQYGDNRMKPTDLWGYLPNWIPKEPCKNGDKCHEASPRGSRTGTQGIQGAKNRSVVPYQLGKELLDVITRHAV